ncbi:MAG TPA: hypothetical protein VGI83_02525 [Gemmatimonadales bacterium]
MPLPRLRLARPLLLVAVLASACEIDKLVDTPGAPGGAPVRLSVSTQPLTVMAGAVFSMAVSAVDSSGNVVTSFADPVTLALASNPANGTLSGTTTVSAMNGVAQFGDLMLDKASAGYAIGVSAGGLALTSDTISVVPGDPARLAWAVPPSPVPDDSVMRPAIKVSVVDGFGNVVSTFDGVVTLALGKDGSARGGTTLSGTVSATASAGVATFDAVQLDQPGQGYTLRAASGGLTSESAPFDVTGNTDLPPPPVATHLIFSAQPGSAQTGASLGPVSVSALDASNAVVTSFAGTITVVIGTNPGGGALSGTLSVVASGGVATFSSLSIDKAGSGYTLTAASAGLTGATSTAFNITAPPPPPPSATHLIFSSQPASAQTGNTLGTVSVSALDASNNVVTAFAGAITLAIGANPGGGSLSGTTTVAAVNGVATLSNLSINQAGTGYTLSASSVGLTGATSGTFNVTSPPPPPPVATHLAFTVQPSTVQIGSAMPAVQVIALDDQGNRVTTFTGTITVAIASDGSLLGNASLGGTRSVAAVNGVATFSNLSINQLGVGYTLTASSSGLTNATSAAFSVVTL